MNKLLLAAAASALAFTAMPAAAADWYAQLNVGGSVQSDADADLSATYVNEDDETVTETLAGDLELDNGLVIGAAGGVSLGNGFRLEGEALYNTNDLGGSEDLDIDNVEVSHMAFFANVLYDIPMEGFTPYVGAGIGYGSISFEVDGDSIHDEDTVWQLRAGVSYPVNDTLTLDVGYRYVNMAAFETTIEDVVIDDSVDPELTADIGLNFEPTAHILSVGARFKLGGAAS